MVEAVNKHVDPRFVDLGSFRDQTIVRVSVSDVDEPPIFQPAEGTIMEVQEDMKVGALVGIVTARDPDVKNKPVRYDRELSKLLWRKGWCSSNFMHLINVEIVFTLIRDRFYVYLNGEKLIYYHCAGGG